MNWKLWICVIAGVAVVHIGLFFVIFHIRQWGTPYVPPPQPNFEARTFVYVDEKTGEKLKTVKEFKVSTKFEDEPKAATEKPTDKSALIEKAPQP